MTLCLSRLALAKLKTGDLEGELKESALAHIETCERCTAAAAEMEVNVSRYEARDASHREKLMARIDAEGNLPSPSRRGWLSSGRSRALLGAVGVAAAAAMALLVLRAPTSSPATDEIRFKGTLSLQVVAKRADRQFTVKEGSTLLEDDALRFVVTTGMPGYLQVFSVDAKGGVSPFYPESDPMADPEPLTLSSAGRHELPGSVILDDSVGRERIVVVFSEGFFNRAEVIDLMTTPPLPGEVGEAGSRTLNSDIHVQILSIDKRHKPGK